MARLRLLAAATALTVTVVESSEMRARVHAGRDAAPDAYAYVVGIQRLSLLNNITYLHTGCSGSLITQQWVLTAAHCIDRFVKQITYGNKTILTNTTKSISKALQMITHPSYRLLPLMSSEKIIHPGAKHCTNDIGLIKIEPVHLNVFGKMSAIDYKTAMGFPVTYVSFGPTVHEASKKTILRVDTLKSLLQGEGTVISCNDDSFNWGPVMCVAPTCTNKEQQANAEHSGGPLLREDRIIGVHNGFLSPSITKYTPVSPYLDWIHDVVKSK